MQPKQFKSHALTAQARYALCAVWPWLKSLTLSQPSAQVCNQCSHKRGTPPFFTSSAAWASDPLNSNAPKCLGEQVILRHWQAPGILEDVAVSVIACNCGEQGELVFACAIAERRVWTPGEGRAQALRGFDWSDHDKGGGCWLIHPENASCCTRANACTQSAWACA